MSVNYKMMTYKDFHSICKDTIELTFEKQLNGSTSTELFVKFKWYCNFISYFIQSNKIYKLSDFELRLRNNAYFEQDRDMAIKLFNNLKLILLNKYSLIDIMDITNFCEKVESDIKV